MSLEAGARLGPYEILSSLGSGGMGEVYRAHDTTLNRDVAVKVLPAAMADDAERVARFQREAEVLAALNHPNIAHIHSLERSGATAAIVMELVEGPTLADRLRTGALPVAEAIAIARQVAEALEAAHDRGVIHRDLKPTNIKVRADGTVKVLDFGLAKALAAGASEAQDPSESSSPTVTQALETRAGVILGTPAYMAPEQARGLPVDRRVDVWAFGVVLYEMLSGRRPFDGRDSALMMAAILGAEPDWDRLPRATPPVIRVFLQRCLAKDPRQRVRDMGDLRLALDGLLDLPSAPDGRRVRFAVPAIVTLLGGAVLFLLATYLRSPITPSRPIVHLVASVHPADRLSAAEPLDFIAHRSMLRPSRTAIALSPDGRLLVFSGASGQTTQLYARWLDQAEAEPLADTAGADSPFFSPDGRWIGFWAEGQIRRLPVDGGPVAVVCDADPLFGATWTDDDHIIFATQTHGLVDVPATGGSPQPLTTISDGEYSHRLPHAIAGTNALVFTVVPSAFVWQGARIELLDRSTGRRTALVEEAVDARYVSTGHLIFARMGALLAVPFDVSQFRTTGPHVVMIDDVMHAVLGANTRIDSGAAQMAVSADGTLAYVPGGAYPPTEDQPILLDRQGRETPLGPAAGIYGAPRVSPDGSRIAFFGQLPSEAAGDDILVHDRSRPNSIQRLTDEGQQQFPVWSPDGSRIAYASSSGGLQNLFWVAADGSEAPEQLTTSAHNQIPAGFTPDGHTLLFVQGHPETQLDIWSLDLREQPPRAEPVVRTRFLETSPALSPDGRWLAYTSDRDGRPEVYVQPFPGPGAAVLVSDGGGHRPVWTSTHELAYRGQGPVEGGAIVVVTLRTSPALEADPPRVLFTTVPPCCSDTAPIRGYDAMPDGGFIMLKRALKPPTPVTEVQIVVHWTDALADKTRAR